MHRPTRKSQPSITNPEEAEALYKDGMIRSDPNEPIDEENPEDVIWNKPHRLLPETDESRRSSASKGKQE